MTARPIYGIAVEDFVDHVEWTLTRDGDEVATGRVELAAYQARPEVSMVGMAFARAWQDANHERVTRFLDDLHTVQTVAKIEETVRAIERQRSDAELQDALDEGGAW